MDFSDLGVSNDFGLLEVIILSAPSVKRNGKKNLTFDNTIEISSEKRTFCLQCVTGIPGIRLLVDSTRLKICNSAKEK